MALEMPLDADSCCAYLGVEGHYKVYYTFQTFEWQYKFTTFASLVKRLSP